MIENVLTILQATLTDETVDAKQILAASHPLGRFNDSTMKAIAAFENSPRGYEELYSTVLIDTPVGACGVVVCPSLVRQQCGCVLRVLPVCLCALARRCAFCAGSVGVLSALPVWLVVSVCPGGCGSLSWQCDWLWQSVLAV